MTKIRKFLPLALFALGITAVVTADKLTALGCNLSLLVQIILWLFVVSLAVFCFVGSIIFHHRQNPSA